MKPLRPEPQAYRPRLGWALRRGAGDYYDRLGLTVSGSLLMSAPLVAAWALLDRLPLSTPVKAALVVSVSWFWIAFGWAVNMTVAHRIAYLEEPGLDAIWDTFRHRGFAVLKLAALDFAVTGIMVFDTLFFISRQTSAMRVVGVVTAYFALLWLMTLLWQWPFLVLDEVPAWKVVKKSALVTLDNPFFTAGVFFVTMLAGIALIVSGIGAIGALGGGLSCFLLRAHREVLKKYGMVADEPDLVEDPGWPTNRDPPRRLHPRDLNR